MSNLTVKGFFNSEIAQQKLQELVGKNASSFATSVLQVVNSNDMLAKSDPATVFTAACMAATLNLPINNSLGFAYIVPFNNRKAGRVEAQFQLGYKGFVQLAQRTGQFKRINACPIYDGDTEESIYERLTAFLPKQPSSNNKIGYVAYFSLINGFEAHLSMTMQEIEAHAKKYSQSYKSGYGIWKDNFDAMAQKTVIKLLLSKQAPLSIDTPLAQAVEADQAVIRDVNGYQVFDYEDNKSQQPAVEMNIANDPTLFANIKQSIISGELDKGQVLSGEAGYIFSDEQRQELISA